MTKRVKRATELFRKGGIGNFDGLKASMTPREREQLRKNMRDIINNSPEWD